MSVSVAPGGLWDVMRPRIPGLAPWATAFRPSGTTHTLNTYGLFNPSVDTLRPRRIPLTRCEPGQMQPPLAKIQLRFVNIYQMGNIAHSTSLE